MNKFQKKLFLNNRLLNTMENATIAFRKWNTISLKALKRGDFSLSAKAYKLAYLNNEIFNYASDNLQDLF